MTNMISYQGLVRTFLNNGLHVELPEGIIKAAKYFPQTTSWVKCDMVQTVSNQRLSRPMEVGRGWITQMLSREIVTNLQKAVIKAINATALVPAQQESEQ